MPRVRMLVLVAFFAVQAVVAGVAYRNAQVDKYTQPFGWQMFVGQTRRPTYTLIRPTGEEVLPVSSVLYSFRSELNDELTFDHRVFEFVCRTYDNVQAIRVTARDYSRTVSCSG